MKTRPTRATRSVLKRRQKSSSGERAAIGPGTPVAGGVGGSPSSPASRVKSRIPVKRGECYVELRSAAQAVARRHLLPGAVRRKRGTLGRVHLLASDVQ